MKQLAVLNILDTPQGHTIAKRMLSWLEPNYQVTTIYHDGTNYEYEGLKALQELVLKHKRPALYLHTRGAVNTHWSTPLTHLMWQEQFTDNAAAYFDAVNTKEQMVACPFSDESKTTWYNGFVLNYAAAKALTIEQSNNRLYYERLFCQTDIPVQAILSNGGVKASRQYMHKFDAMVQEPNQNGTDIVYIIGRGSRWNNNELRFSLRSLAKYGQNIRRVIIVGECPDFVNREKVVYIPAKDETRCKHTNILRKIQKCIETLKMTEPFLISSDDHFYTQPTNFLTYPHFTKGELYQQSTDHEYERSLNQTNAWLEAQGWPTHKTNPHCNTWIDPKALAAILPTLATADAPDGIEINCALGNFYAAKGGELTTYQDGKVMHPLGYHEWQERANANHCLSIADQAIDMNLCRFLLQRYPNQSQYETNSVTLNQIYSIKIAVQLKKRQ